MNRSKEGKRAPARARERRTQVERKEETRNRLLEAAIEILRSKGYANFRTAAVSEQAKVSGGAQLYHFPSKEDLVIATLQRLFERARTLSEKRAADVAPDADLLVEIAEDAWQFYFGEDFFASLEIVASGSKNSDLWNRVQEIAAGERAPVEGIWIAKLVSTGVPGATAELIVWTLHSVIRGLALRSRFAEAGKQLENTRDFTIALCRSYLQAAGS